LEPEEESLLLESSSELLDWLRDLALPFSAFRWSSFRSSFSLFAFALIAFIS